MLSAFYFFGGLADIFLSVMLWFILDSNRSAIIFIDGNNVYSVAEVIKQNVSTVNDDSEEDSN